MVQNVLETNLAWALIEAAKPHLSRSERDVIFVVVGAGDTFGTIRRLFDCIASKQIPLRADLVMRCSAWLDAYARHEEQQYLRRLLAGFLIECNSPAPSRLRPRTRIHVARRSKPLGV